MRAGHASRTAEHNALFRALESGLPESRRLFTDPFARSFLSRPYSLLTWAARVPGLRELIPRLIDHRWPGVRSSVVARTRLIDEVIADSLGAHIEQLVILGAGFDSRAYRLPGLRDVTVFEVDHPDTQAAKRRTLQRVLSTLPTHVRFVGIDFKPIGAATVCEAFGARAPERSTR